MPYAKLNGANLWYTDSQHGDETIIFVHGLLLSGEMYLKQVEALESGYRCVTLDLRGQGQSEAAETGYDIDSLTGDVVAVIDLLDLAPCHFVGLSMGGFIGLRIGIYHPDLLLSLALLDTSADPEPSGSARKYRFMAWIVKWLGFRPVIGSIMKIMFGRSFLADPQKSELQSLWKERILSNDRIGILKSALGVIDRKGVASEAAKIKCPCAVMVGEEDVATPPQKSQRMHAAIDGSRMVIIAGAGHSAPIEQPDAVTQALQDFLSSLDRHE